MAYIAAHIIYRNAQGPRVVQYIEIEEFEDTEETGVLKCKCQASAKCEFLCTCMVWDTLPKGVTTNVTLNVTTHLKIYKIK